MNTRQKSVASALRSHGSRLGWVRAKRSFEELADANQFLLGVMFDMAVPTEQAWRSGQILADSFGNQQAPDEVWSRLAAVEQERLEGFLRYGDAGRALHRWYRKYARWIPAAALRVCESYGGDPRTIWQHEPDPRRVMEKIDELPGIGPNLARMAVLILARNGCLAGGRSARKHLDVKVDVHMRRVFTRAGLVRPGATDSQIIEAARILAPDFPGSLDPGAWSVGNQYCHTASPQCNECPIQRNCLKVGVRRR